MNRPASIIVVAALLSASIVWGGAGVKAPGFEAGRFFSGKCAGCHGIRGQGSPLKAAKFRVELADMNLQGEPVRAKTDGELAKIILNGSGKMPAFRKSLDDGQAAGMAAYIRTLGGKAAVKAEPAGTKPDGAVIFTSRSCVNCHGKDGKGVARVAKMLKADASAMDLTGTEARGKSDADLAAIIFKGAEGGKMPSYGAKLTREEIDSVVKYIRELK
jgi:cbb3-type cytochrome c oxidase subunit III